LNFEFKIRSCKILVKVFLGGGPTGLKKSGKIKALPVLFLTDIYKSAKFIYTGGGRMKTLVDIDEEILREAMKAAEVGTKKEAITLALQELIKSRLRLKLRGLAGSGLLDTRLLDLKRLRNRRKEVHQEIRKER
jgi:Arc/MetJ family transcription regulator